MSTIKDGGPAFPAIHPEFGGLDSDGNERWDNGPQSGMTLRDYFAAKAMQGAFSIKALSELAGFQKIIAQQAYMMADAMLAAREAQP